MKRQTIFVSHAYADEALTRQYVAELRRLGHDVWVDFSGLDVGTHISEEITVQLNARDVLVVLWIPYSVTKPNVMEECRYFLKRLPDWPRKRFIPVHAVECDIHAHLQLGLTPEVVLERLSLGQYLYVDGRKRAVAETAAEIALRLEEPAIVPQSFRLDALTERELVDKVRSLITNKFRTVVEPKLGDVRADLIFVKPDELLGGGEVIVVELKKYKAERRQFRQTLGRVADQRRRFRGLPTAPRLAF